MSGSGLSQGTWPNIAPEHSKYTKNGARSLMSERAPFLTMEDVKSAPSLHFDTFSYTEWRTTLIGNAGSMMQVHVAVQLREHELGCVGP